MLTNEQRNAAVAEAARRAADTRALSPSYSEWTAQQANTSGGIWGGSTATAHADLIIFATGNNIARECAFRAWAEGHRVPYKSLIGSYKGAVERSFVAFKSDWPRLLPWFEAEESVLHLGPAWREGVLHGDRVAVLEFMADRALLELGMFGYQTREFALRQEGWTYDPQSGAYYCVTS